MMNTSMLLFEMELPISNSKSYKFKHNDLENLAQTIEKVKKEGQIIYVVTESVFSMDGDSPDLISLADYCTANGFYLIVDEAHAIGVFGEKGRGEIQRLGIENQVFARVITFGKALGCHGAAILGGNLLRDYLINFSRSFIYTTSLPPHSLATLLFAYQEMEESDLQDQLNSNIELFKSELIRLKLQSYFIESASAIQSCVINGSNRIKKIAAHIQEKGFIIKPILSPTVPLGSERLRFCIHSYNSKKEISEVLELLATFCFKRNLNNAMQKKIFVTGISTEVGKTIISSIITEALQADYWKPIQSGDLHNSDSDKIKSLISNSKTVIHPNSYAMETPMSPHASAKIDGITIELENIVEPETDNHLVIEGAGGILVPLNENDTVLDIISKEYQVIVVSRQLLRKH